MKIRSGFISNSSSTSFLVAFETNPKSVEEIYEIIKGHRHASKDMAEIIFQKIDREEDLEDLKISDIVKDMFNLVYIDFMQKYHDIFGWHNIFEHVQNEDFIEFLLSHKDSHFVEIGFCDECQPDHTYLDTMDQFPYLGFEYYQILER